MGFAGSIAMDGDGDGSDHCSDSGGTSSADLELRESGFGISGDEGGADGGEEEEEGML